MVAPHCTHMRLVDSNQLWLVEPEHVAQVGVEVVSTPVFLQSQVHGIAVGRVVVQPVVSTARRVQKILPNAYNHWQADSANQAFSAIPCHPAGAHLGVQAIVHCAQLISSP